MVPWQVTERTRLMRVPVREAVGPGESLPCPAPWSVPSAAGPQRPLPATSSHLPHFLATCGLRWGRCSLWCCKQEKMRTASKSPAGKEMVVSPCGQASCGPKDARCSLYTRGGGAGAIPPAWRCSPQARAQKRRQASRSRVEGFI